MTDKTIEEKVGKRVIDMLNANSEALNIIKKLEKICNQYSKNDSVYDKDGWGRKMILEWAYAGCVFSALNGREGINKRLGSYTKGIKNTLESNKYSDPVFYVKEVFNAAFK